MFNKLVITRWLFVIVSFIIISLVLWNTYQFFTQLKQNERQKMQIWAAAQEELQQIDFTNKNWDSNLIVKVLQSNTTTPMILYSHGDDVYSSNNIDSTLVNQPKKIEELKKRFSAEYKPIEIFFRGELLQTIYYGNSPIINKIKYYPLVLIIIIFLFFLVVYFFLQTSKSAEQNKLWAGMAKETAHQIGTPLSSLVGWAEILKEENVNPSYIVEIEKDISRLKTITERFSNIGSIPKLDSVDLILHTQHTFDYLKARTSKLINFEMIIPEEKIIVNLNPQLYSWTIENLVKNAIDAMRGKGHLDIAISELENIVKIKITDTGKGIPKNQFQKIFEPGFTTKKRGWGLGLSLTKRIVQEYHKGKIKVAHSEVGKGTTIQISYKTTQKNLE